MSRLTPLCIALVATLAACGSGSTTTASPTASGGAATGSITVYSGQHEQTMTALVKDFTSRTGIKVDVRSDDEATLANQLLQEGSKSPADVFVAENPPAQAVVDAKGLLAKTDASTLAQVPATDSSTDGTWVGVSARTATLAYNPTKIDESALPAGLLDLAKPAFKGKVGFAPSETDFQPLITAITKLDGAQAATDWLKGLKANAMTYDDNESLMKDVEAGTVATGLIDHYYWYRLRDEEGASGFVAKLHAYTPGDPGNLVDVSGAAVLASSKNKPAAQAFLAYLVSEPAQTIIATSESYEYPLRAGVTDTRLSTQLADLQPPAITIGDLGDGSAALQALMDAGLL